MKISFLVGRSEKHQVNFKWNQFIGRAVIKVDDRAIIKSKPLVLNEVSRLVKTRLQPISGLKTLIEDIQNMELRKQWTFEVGRKEMHLVTIGLAVKVPGLEM
jgi:hypothetical protein